MSIVNTKPFSILLTTSSILAGVLSQSNSGSTWDGDKTPARIDEVVRRMEKGFVLTIDIA